MDGAKPTTRLLKPAHSFPLFVFGSCFMFLRHDEVA